MNDRSGKIRYVRVVLIVLLLAATLKAFVLDAVHVGTRSMEGSVIPGDFLLLDKTGYGGRYTEGLLPAGTHSLIPGFLSGKIPRRGAVVAFLPPADVHSPDNGPVPTVIKRCIAIGGDTVTLLHGILCVNGTAVTGAPIEAGEFLKEGRTLRVPRKGDVLRLNPRSVALWRNFLRREGHRVSVGGDGSVFLDGEPVREYTVDRDYLFVLGDHHTLSFDSRHWGLLDADRVIGEPVMVYWSLGEGGAIRWGRIGTIIR